MQKKLDIIFQDMTMWHIKENNDSHTQFNVGQLPSTQTKTPITLESIRERGKS